MQPTENIVKFCLIKKHQCRQDAPSDQPSGMKHKSEKRRQRDCERMGAYNAHKVLMAHLPFANVTNDPLQKLMPRSSCGSTTEKLQNKIDELKKNCSSLNRMTPYKITMAKNNAIKQEVVNHRNKL